MYKIIEEYFCKLGILKKTLNPDTTKKKTENFNQLIINVFFKYLKYLYNIIHHK